jgi:NADH-quinone oxidoreductase subunit C
MRQEFETTRPAARALADHLGQDFLGTREDRGELTLWVNVGVWRRTAAWLVENTGFKLMSDLTAMDYLDRIPRFDVSMIMLNQESNESMRIKTLVEGPLPSGVGGSEHEILGEIDSLIPVWAGANWFEREIYDLFGIRFKDHPNMKRLLLPPDYQGYPLRKDYPVTGPATSAFR